jgi:hypothetical protein
LHAEKALAVAPENFEQQLSPGTVGDRRMNEAVWTIQEEEFRRGKWGKLVPFDLEAAAELRPGGTNQTPAKAQPCCKKLNTRVSGSGIWRARCSWQQKMETSSRKRDSEPWAKKNELE